MNIRMDLDCEAPAPWESALAAPPRALLEPAFRALSTVLANRASGNFSDRRVSVALSLVDDAAITAMNGQFRGRAMPTNVLSFPAPDSFRAETDEDGVATEFLGDIAIARETLLREAAGQSKPPAHHFLHLAIHGTLHLLGFDHVLAHEAEDMEETERACLSLLGIDDPYLLPPEDHCREPGSAGPLAESTDQTQHSAPS